MKIALAYYPCLDHFPDTIASEGDGQVNKTWGVTSIKDTCIVWISELDFRSRINPTGGAEIYSPVLSIQSIFPDRPLVGERRGAYIA